MAALHMVEQYVARLVLCWPEVCLHALAHGPAYGEELMFSEVTVRQWRLLGRALQVEGGRFQGYV